jgi:hypothetical protein
MNKLSFPKSWIFIVVILCIAVLTHTETETNATIQKQPKSQDREDLEVPTSDTLADYLLFKINYLYRPGGKGEFRNLTNGSVLRSGDHYKIIFTPTKDCYVYIFQVDSANKIYSLFPMESFGGVTVNNFNPVEAGRSYYIPAESKSFVLDEQTGTEKIYFLASYQRDLELEEQYQRTFVAQQQKQGVEEQLEQIDQLLRHAMEVKGLADVVSEPAETERMFWEEEGQTFSVLQQRLENMCDGCVHALTFGHE